MRAPSSLNSRAASPRSAMRLFDIFGGLREHGLHRLEQLDIVIGESQLGHVRGAARAMAMTSPATMAAWRTRSTGSLAAWATASSMMPSRAPWRSSPSRSAAEKLLLGSVARENRCCSSDVRSRPERERKSSQMRDRLPARSSCGRLRRSRMVREGRDSRCRFCPVAAAGKKRGDDFDLVAMRFAKQGGEQRYFCAAFRDRGNPSRSFDQVIQQHHQHHDRIIQA